MTNLAKHTQAKHKKKFRLHKSGILKNVLDGVRILGDGELTKKLTVRAQGFTKSAIEKIEKVGGKAEVI